MIHATGFALFYASMVHITYDISPIEINTTMFGVVGAIFSSLAVAVANIVGGLIYDKHGGGKSIFLILAIEIVVWTTIVSIYLFAKKCFGREKYTKYTQIKN